MQEEPGKGAARAGADNDTVTGRCRPPDWGRTQVQVGTFTFPPSNCPSAQRACLLASPLQPVPQGQGPEGGSGAPGNSPARTSFGSETRIPRAGTPHILPCGLGRIQIDLPQQGVSGPGIPSLSREGQGKAPLCKHPHPGVTRASVLAIPPPPACTRWSSLHLPWPLSPHVLWTLPLESLPILGNCWSPRASLPAFTPASTRPFLLPTPQPSFQNVNPGMFPQNFKLQRTQCIRDKVQIP